jgi:hypothetical protein
MLIINKFMHFIKLKDNISYNPFEFYEKKFFFGKDGYGLSYYKLDDQNNHLFRCIKEPYRKYFYIILMKINILNVRPHTDSNIKVTINFYVQTNSCKTTFYKFKNSNYSETKIENQTNGSVFEFEDLVEDSSFVAEDNEMWILDVETPHSVTSLTQTKNERIALCLQSEVLSFKETLEVIDYAFLNTMERSSIGQDIRFSS